MESAAAFNAMVLGNAEKSTREENKRLNWKLEKARNIIDRQAHEIERLQVRVKELEDSRKATHLSALKWRETAKEWLCERDKWRDAARELGKFSVD